MFKIEVKYNGKSYSSFKSATDKLKADLQKALLEKVKSHAQTILEKAIAPLREEIAKENGTFEILLKDSANSQIGISFNAYGFSPELDKKIQDAFHTFK